MEWRVLIDEVLQDDLVPFDLLLRVSLQLFQLVLGFGVTELALGLRHQRLQLADLLLHGEGKYLEEDTLVVDFAADGVFNVSADLLLDDVVLLLDALDTHHAILVQLIEPRSLTQQASS